MYVPFSRMFQFKEAGIFIVIIRSSQSLKAYDMRIEPALTDLITTGFGRYV